MIKKAYGLMSEQEKEDYSRLIALEVNSFLDKIYKTMKTKLKHTHIKHTQFNLKHASLGATKMWEFSPSSREEAAKGNVGKITVVTRGMENNTVRKQRALFIAAEAYVYHAFANHFDDKRYNAITRQNQYLDIFRKLFGISNAHDIRDRAIRYVVEDISEHKLASFRDTGWVISIADLKKHHPDIAAAVGSSEKTFHEIFRKQHQKFTPVMFKQEEDLVRKEIEDIDHLLGILSAHEKKNHDRNMKKLVHIHVQNLKMFRTALEKIKKNLDAWFVADTKDHKVLKKKLHLTPRDMHELLLAESKAEKVDINKVHIVFDYFQKEKINILRDIELLDRMSASGHKHHKK